MSYGYRICNNLSIFYVSQLFMFTIRFKYGWRTRCFYGHHRVVHVYLAKYIPADKYTHTQEQSISSWQMFNSSWTRISKMPRVLLI